MTLDDPTDPADPIDTADSIDPADMALDELRGARQQLLLADDAVSYARRIAQARLDLVVAESDRRTSDPDAGAADADVGAATVEAEPRSADLRTVLSSHLTGGSARPPRAAEDFSTAPLAVELDAICSTHGFARLPVLDPPELAALAAAITAFERRVSSRRQELFDRLDALSAELVKRYRDGAADVDSLHL